MQGFEERTVVPTQGPAGQANRPARQLGQVGVSAPRGGDTRQFGAAERVLQETVKMGGEALMSFLEKRKMKDRLAGKMDYTQGRTEAELVKAGLPTARLEGFKALKAKTAYDEWYAKTAHDVDNERAAETPEQFKQSLMNEAADIFDHIDMNDPDSVALAENFVNDGFNKLVSRQTANHAVFMKDEVSNTLANTMVSSALAGDTESLFTIINEPEKLGLDMSKAEIDDVVIRAARQTLQEGDFTIFDMLGGEQGLRNRNISEGQMQSIQNVYKQAQGIEEASNMQDILVRKNEIMRNVKAENISMQEAFEQLDGLRQQYRQEPGYARSMVNSIVQEYSRNAELQEEAGILSNPYFIEDAADLMREVQFAGITTSQGTNKALKLAEKYGLNTKMTKDFLNDVTRAHNTYESKITSEMEMHYKKVEERKKKESDAMNLINTNFTDSDSADSSTKQLAMDMKKDIIIREVMNDPNFDTDEEKVAEVIRKHVSFLRNTAVKDQKLRRDFAIVGQASPTDEQGNLNEAHTSALQYMQAMREGGVSERTIKEYVGDAYTYLSTAAVLTTGTTDPRTALLTAFDSTMSPDAASITPKTDYREAYKEWEGIKEDFFDNVEPSIVSGWFGSESDAKYDEILTYQVKEAFKNSEDVDAWARDQMKAISTAFPALPQEAVIEQVKRDLSAWEYVMGDLVPPRNGQSISDMMGLSETEGAMVSNSAMLSFMQDNADLLFPKGTEQEGWWESVSQGFGDTLDMVIFEPDKLTGLLVTGDSDVSIGSPVSFAQSFLLGWTEKDQRLKNNIPMMNVTPMSNGQLMIAMYDDTDRTDLIGYTTIPAKDIGDYFKAKKSQRQREASKRGVVGQAISNSLKE